jgi:hypothetical protein
MPNKRIMAACAILTILTSAMQTLPAPAAVLSGIPIYVAVRLNLMLGAASCLTAAYITSRLGLSELLFFMCSAGIVGLSLGMAKEYFKSLLTPPAVTALIVFVTLSFINYYLGIGIFGYSPLRTPMKQAMLLLPPLYIYSLIYFKLSAFADSLLNEYIELKLY